jgi:monofunctional biosynthetic peptidoglycan transglycosylase
MSSAPRRKTIPSAMRRILPLVALLLAVLVLIPFVLALLYRVVDPVSTPMLWRGLTGERVERIWVPLAAMASALPATVVAAEDGRFCGHRGVDFAQLREAIEEVDDIADARGGSTITQQTAKNLFLWSSRSFVRKALELPLALWLDLVLPKTRILEIYLNIAEWGPDGEFGAEAGARYAFGKPARALTPREAALLAAILPNPIERSARRPGPGVQRLAGIYQARAVAVSTGCIRMPRR